jgi:hypothetical protein
MVVEMKFTAPRIEDTPARCNEKIARSTDAPAWAIPLARGGYTVHPVPGPLSTILLVSKSVSDGGNRILYYLFVGRLCPVLLVLMGPINYRILQL